MSPAKSTLRRKSTFAKKRFWRMAAMMMDEDQDDQGNKRLVGANFQSSSDQNNENGDFELRTISSTNDDYIVPPPETRLTFGSIRDSMLKLNDGGYGWAVVFAVFFVHVVIIGNLFSFGVFFATYNDTFSASQGSIAWIGSIGAFLMSALAHFSGALGDYWGNDKVVCLGGILVGIGYFLASYSTELWHLYFTQGLIAGAGYGIAFVAGVGVVGQWFDKQRGLAVGIAVAGSGFGQFVMTLLTGGLLNKYGWQETLVILASTNMNGIIYGFFGGGVISLVPNVSVELFGVTSLGSTLGLLYSARAIGNLLSAPIGGFLFDGTGNYTASIIVAGSFLSMSSILALCIRIPPSVLELLHKGLDEIDEKIAIEIGRKKPKHEKRTSVVAV